MRRIVTVVAAVLLLAACGSSTIVKAGDPVPSPYDGPMSLPRDHADNANVAPRSGAAGRALECDGRPYEGGGGAYDSGLESVQDSASLAMENLFEEEGLARALPAGGYRIEREDNGRVLLSFDVDDQTKIAFIAFEKVVDYNHHTGWGIESWAQCDPAELPATVTEALGIDVWEDSSGARVPVAKVHSTRGPEHCDWQDITFLQLDLDDQKTEYLRNPSSELIDLLRTTYDASADLPDEATDTGIRRAGRELWLSPKQDAAYLVSLDDSTDVERWPASKQPIRCQ